MEHSFFLWDQKPCKDSDCIAAAVDLYKVSSNCHAVMEAVDRVIREDQGQFFQAGKDHEHVREAFAQKLTQIALDNRLCMSNCPKT